MLKGKKPNMVAKRLKMFIYGKAGIGKTTACLNFPNAYIIDTERGTEAYAKTINTANSAVLQSLDVDDIKADLRELLITKHPYKTLVIDPMTQIYNSVQAKWTKIFEKNAKSAKEAEIGDFGMRYWGKVKSDYKSIQRLLLALDMNVIITAHQKVMYGQGMQQLGDTFDSMKGDDYFFDYIFQIIIKGGKRMAVTIKERSEVGEQKFPAEFEWSYENFKKYYGKDILEKEVSQVELASSAEVEKLTKLIAGLGIEDSVVDKWLSKAEASEFSELTQDQIKKCIKYCDKKLEEIK